PGNARCGNRLQWCSAAASSAALGQSPEPGAVLGQAAALSDRHCRPAQQPPDRNRARQAHRVGNASPDLAVYRGTEDVNFSSDGRLLAVSEEDNYDLQIVDYEQRAVVWTYGVPDHSGSAAPLLNFPDDAHLLSDGKFLTADVRNCRVLVIDPATSRIARE